MAKSGIPSNPTPPAPDPPDALDDAIIGEEIDGRWIVVRRIGGGGMARVFAAWDQATRLTGALKVPLRPELHDRFQREMRLCARLRGSGLPAVHQTGVLSDGKTPYLLFEHLHGITLGDCLRSLRVLPPREAIGIALHVASALAELHAAGVIHRDVKPDNVFLCDAGPIKLLDLGVALAAGEPPITGGQYIGTPRYMAPEQAVAPSEVDERADIYSLGVIVYQMLAGRDALPVPVRGGARPGVVRYPPRAVRRDLMHVPASVAAFVIRATAQHRASRYASAADARRALTACLADVRRTDLTDDDTPQPRPRRRRRPGPFRATISAACAAAAFAAALLLARSLFSPHPPRLADAFPAGAAAPERAGWPSRFHTGEP